MTALDAEFTADSRRSSAKRRPRGSIRWTARCSRWRPGTRTPRPSTRCSAMRTPSRGRPACSVSRTSVPSGTPSRTFCPACARPVFPPELAEPLMRATAGLRAQIGGTAAPIDGLLDDLAASVAVYRGGGFRTRDAPVPDATVPDATVPDAPVPWPTVAKPNVAKPPVAGPPVVVPAVAGPPVAGPPVAEPPVAGPPVAGPRVAEPPVAKPRAPGPAAPERRTLRVPAEKIDHLLDVVGEVVQQRRRLTHSLTEEARFRRRLPKCSGSAIVCSTSSRTSRSGCGPCRSP